MHTRCREWRQLPFIQRGIDSVQRLFEFNDYCRQTPLIHSALRWLLFMLPALLTNPLDGVKANSGAWTRLFFVEYIFSSAIVVQINQVIPQLSLSAVRILTAAFATICSYMVMMVTIASFWVHLNPFGLVLSVPIACVLSVIFHIPASCSRAATNPVRRQYPRAVGPTNSDLGDARRDRCRVPVLQRDALPNTVQVQTCVCHNLASDQIFSTGVYRVVGERFG